jgi:ABC-type lipoprotein export system ATPase subunit
VATARSAAPSAGEDWLIFQFHNVLPFLNATDNVAIVLQLAGFEPADARQRAIELLDYLEVGRRKEAFPSRLSGGEPSALPLPALANRPRIILADEPTPALRLRACSDWGWPREPTQYEDEQ